MTQEATSATFTRRKFTITETLDEVLVDLAAQNYQGNVSLCLRAAIEDHRRTLAGEDQEVVAHQLIMEINELENRQYHVIDLLEGLQEEIKRSGGMSERSINENWKTEEMQQVRGALIAAEDGLRIQDLSEKLERSTSSIHGALGSLLDHGMIVTDHGAPARFWPAGKRRREEDE